jgi:hypothetical protein
MREGRSHFLGGRFIVSGILRLSALALVVCAAARRIASAAVVNTEPSPSEDNWALMDSPFGPGVWLTGPTKADVTHAFIPPGAKASHDESDHDRRGWRHLTIDADLSMRPTVTKLDAHEVFSMVPRTRRGWVMEQSIRHSDGSVRGADLLETLGSMGIEPDMLDRALHALGRRESLGLYCAALRATHTAKYAALAASQVAAGETFERVAVSFAASTRRAGSDPQDDDGHPDRPRAWHEVEGTFTSTPFHDTGLHDTGSYAGH